MRDSELIEGHNHLTAIDHHVVMSRSFDPYALVPNRE